MIGNAPIETAPDGDLAFRGVDMRVHPAQLPPGLVAFARNMRFRNGVAETRPGTAKIGWTNHTDSTGIKPWGTVYGWGVFSDPVTGVQYSLVAADGGVHYTRSHNIAQQLTLPSGVTITAAVEFVQCFDVVVLFRGADLAPLVLRNFNDGFELIDQTTTGTGTLDIPNASYGVLVANRLLIPHDNDLVAASDILDYTRYTLFNDFRINQGEADRLIALKPFGPSTVVALKEQSVYAVSNVYGDLSDIRLSNVTRRYGCVARKSVVDVGTDLLWLSPLGVASLNLTSQNEVQAGGGLGSQPMFSAPIQPLIDRINWNFASAAVGAFWDNKFYLAVPLDDAEVLREELATGAAGSNTTVIVAVTAGQRYRWLHGGEVSLANGSDTYTRSTDFVAAGATVIITVAVPTLAVDGSLRPLFKGVNNAVLVYDFENQAWAGYDTIAGIDFKDFKILTYNNRQRLFFISTDGFVTLYEDGYQDQLAVPYADLTFTTVTPVNGALFRVNLGTTVTVNTASSLNTATTLGAQTTALARTNLWLALSGRGGYSPNGSPSLWTCPDTLPVQVTNGVRFYSTNGLVPTADLEQEADFNWDQTTHIDITSEVQLRGYTNGAPLARKGGQKITVHLETWYPRYTIARLTEGVDTEDVLASAVTRSRRTYDRPHMKEPYTESNVNEDFLTPGRQDYSIGYSSTNTGFRVGTEGVQFGLHQAVQHAVTCQPRARSTQIKLTNDRGRVRLLAAGFQVSGTTDKRKGVRTT
jgi:hypothetical protein